MTLHRDSERVLLGYEAHLLDYNRYLTRADSFFTMMGFWINSSIPDIEHRPFEADWAPEIP